MNQLLDMMYPGHLKRYYWIKYASNLYVLSKDSEIHLNGLDSLELTIIFYNGLNQKTKTIVDSATKSIQIIQCLVQLLTF